MLRMLFSVSLVLLTAPSRLCHSEDPVESKSKEGFETLFDGKTFSGWEGDTQKTWSIEGGAFVAGSLETSVPRNEFLATLKEYANFELRLRYKLVGTEGFVNGGVQFRSRRIPNHHEVIGYQADLGAGYDGYLYDESRRNRMLTEPAQEIIARILRSDDWNDYRILAVGPKIQIWLNGVKTVDYTEKNAGIPLEGIIAVQIHGGCKAVVRYRDFEIRELEKNAAQAIIPRVNDPKARPVSPDASRLREGLIGYWSLDGNVESQRPKLLVGKLQGGATFVGSPFGKALSVNGKDGYAVVPRDAAMDIGDGEFSVAAWIRARDLRQAGFICLGRYAWVNGWYLDMPGPNGVVRIETASPLNRSNGTVKTRAGAVVPGVWTHVAASVKRGTNGVTVYVNGYPAAQGSIRSAVLDNPTTNLHIGRIEGAQIFDGEIDEVYLFRRALEPAEVQALVEPGREFAVRPTPLAPSVERFGERRVETVGVGRFPNGQFTLVPGDVVALIGQTDVVRSRHDATLERLLVQRFAHERPRFRNMAWEGDTVFEQWRDLNFGSWEDQLASIRASVVIAQFGQMEALGGAKKIDAFVLAYDRLLDQFATRTERIVLVSPRPFEKPSRPYIPDHSSKNELVERYAEAIKNLARKRGYVFVDLLTPVSDGRLASPLTANGIHLRPEAQPLVAREIARQLGVSESSNAASALRAHLLAAIVEKNRLWFDNWRPMNWTFAFGDRTGQPFGKPYGDRPSLRAELEAFKPLIQEADGKIFSIANALRDGLELSVTPPKSPRIDPESSHDSVAHAARREQATFEVAEGYEVNLFASEADGVVNPLQMRWDDANRLWVLCAPTYPHIEPGAKPGDYVLVCEDTDHDGRADRFHKFAEGLFMPMGIEFGDGGVYLAEATELVHLVDSDGDGRADSRRILLSGFGTADSHQMINGLAWGPSGALWFTQGHHVYSHVETAWGISRLHKAGVWRFRPRRDRLDGFFNLSTAGLNCQGVEFDDYGQIFHNSAAYSGGFYTVPGMVPTLHPRRFWAMAVPDRRNTGIEFIGTAHLPDELQGAVVWGGFMSNSVQLHRLVDEASGFTAKVMPDLLKSSKRDFRPVNVRVGPDGAIYVCDWYNSIIGHYQASYRDPKRDKTHGRIWRITAKNRPPVTPTDITKLSASALLDKLRSTERLVRRNAKRRLFGLSTDEVIAAIDSWLAALDTGDADYDRLFLEAVGICEAHEVVRPDRLRQLLDSENSRLRAYGARVVGNWADRLENPLDLLRKCIRDPHPRVRLEAVVACNYVMSPESIEIATQAVDMPMDRFLHYALSQTVHALKPQWFPALSRGELRFDGQIARLRFVLEADGTGDVSTFVKTLAASDGLSNLARERLLALLIDIGDGDDLRFAWDRAPRSKVVLDALANVAFLHSRRPTGDLATSLRPLVHADDLGLRAAAIQLAGAWRIVTLSPDVSHVLVTDASPEPIVIAALKAYASIDGPNALPIIKLFLQANHSLAVRTAATQSLATVDLKQAAVGAVRIVVASTTQEEIAAILSPFLSRRGGSEELARELRDADLPVDIAKLTHRALSAAGRSDGALLSVLNKAIGIENRSQQYDASFVRALAAEATSKGDASRGRRVFSSKLANCTACHRISGSGGDTGPDLTIVGAGRSPELLTESILFPDRQIREGYMSRLVVTKAGRIFTGYQLKESEDELHLRDTTTNNVRRIAKSSILSVQDAGSIMPAGATSALTRRELRDLIRFLSDLGRIVDD